MKVALLGATGYIGRSLLSELQTRGIEVVPFTRDPQKAAETLSAYHIVAQHDLRSYDVLKDTQFDLVVNATGIGSPRALKENPAAVFEVTEMMDTVLLSYVQKYPAVHIINMSSGAVYGTRAASEISDATVAEFNVSGLTLGNAYGIAKLASEAKHRAHPQYGIVDLRVFTFFSRHCSLTESFFLSELARAIVQKETFRTNGTSIIRDCITTPDLVNAILFFANKEQTNDAFDLVSKAPFEKFALLKKCEQQFGLSVAITETVAQSPTGQKNVYASASTKLAQAGFVTRRTSEEAIITELEALLSV